MFGTEERFHVRRKDAYSFRNLNYLFWAHCHLLVSLDPLPHTPDPCTPHTGQTHRGQASTRFAGATQPPSGTPCGGSGGGQPSLFTGVPSTPGAAWDTQTLRWGLSVCSGRLPSHLLASVSHPCPR